MTDEERKEEGTEEEIEDLEAPAETQSDVAGGAGRRCRKTGRCKTKTVQACDPPTCVSTTVFLE